MNENELNKLLDDFYEVRGDNYARTYLKDFVKLISSSGISPSQFDEWFKINKNKFGMKYGKNTLRTYQSVLKQFIKYVKLAEGLGPNYYLHSSSGKKGIKIYDNFYTFQQNCSDKFF